MKHTQFHGFLPYQSWAVLRDLNLTSLDPRNRASCGFFALHHAMVFLGQGARFQWLRELHPRTGDMIHGGTYAEDLTRLAKRLKLKSLVHCSWMKSTPIRKALDRALDKGHPVIVGSEPNIHWICVGGRTGDGDYVWADSAEDPALGTCSWDELEEWLLYSDKPGRSSYPDLSGNLEIIEIAPGREMPASRSMVPWIGAIWKNLAADPAYARDWTNLLADMLDVFWDRDYAPKGRPSGEFLDEHLDAIVEAVAYQTGRPKANLHQAGLGYRDVADFHSLVVPAGEEAGVIAGLTIKLVAKAK